MTLGEIKIEAIKLMGANEGEMSEENLSDLSQDERYKDYLSRMTGAINRCFADIEAKKALPVKAYTITLTDTDSEYLGSFNTADIADFGCISRVTATGENRHYGSVDYFLDAGIITLPKNGDLTYKLIYHPNLTRIMPYDNNGDEIDLPQEIAALIPYFIKGDLYRQDEPNEAGEARNFYENGIQQYIINRITAGNQHSVISEYCMP